jgi:hypothetical protein
MPLFDNQGNIAVPTTGDDVLVLTGSNETVNGDAGNDDLTDEGSGIGNTLNGNAGNDTLFGGTEGFLNGDTGRDIIFASPNGSGGNTITGGLGRDLFVIATAEIPQTANIIKDFNSNLDFIGLSLLPGVDSFEDLTIVDGEGEDEGNTIISFGDDRIAIVEGITADSLTPIDVIILDDGIPILPNEAPEITGSLAFTPELGSSTVGTITATDPDEDELTFSITNDPDELFAIDPITGEITITDIDAFNALPEGTVKTIEVQVSDSLLSDTANVDITRFGTPFNLDIDDNDGAFAFSDGILLIRYLLGQSTGGLTEASLAALGSGAQRTDLDDLNDYIGGAIDILDIDDNNGTFAFSDGILAIRYLLGQNTGGLTQASLAALGSGAQRTDLDDLNAYLGDLMP